ncbi:hypothetical protein QJS04_geneDACA022967 [Acorus gramineus]|uniref:Transposase MuDR plant domain-containing protein n=1 Tax=Acorus gramineus TaxID=55184 RepID=A0AAV9A0B5_ACOGR|nr:hypothetical protein QJS04_geneDACA022967 [Acorus gramineus]
MRSVEGALVTRTTSAANRMGENISASNRHLEHVYSSFQGTFDQIDEEDPDIKTWVKFEYFNALRHALRQYDMKKKFSLKFIKSEPSRLTAKCETETCPWGIYASVLLDNPIEEEAAEAIRAIQSAIPQGLKGKRQVQ